MSRKKITIQGGGIAGLTCAITLRKLGYEVEIFERQNLEELFAADFCNLDDIQIIVMKEEFAELLTGFLGISLTRAKNIYCNYLNDIYELNPTNFYLVKKGFSNDSINYQLYKKALEYGVKFTYTSIYNCSSQFLDNPIYAMGNNSNNEDYKIYGWKINLDCEIDDQVTGISLDPITNEYLYIAKLGNKISCILLSRNNISSTDVLDYYKYNFPQYILNPVIKDIKKFVFRKPSIVKNPYKKQIIGTQRGINDNLLFFGLGDSIIDAINFAFWTDNKSFNYEEYLYAKAKKNFILNQINIIKEISCKFSYKENFIKPFLKSRFLTKIMITLVHSSMSKSIVKEIVRINFSVQKNSQIPVPAENFQRTYPVKGLNILRNNCNPQNSANYSLIDD